MLGFPDVQSEAPWLSLIDQFDIQIPEPYTESQLISFARTFLAKSNAQLTSVDFADMLYLPLLLIDKYNWTYDMYPYIIVDEAQDTNAVQLHLLKALTSRVIAVGDPPGQLITSATNFTFFVVNARSSWGPTVDRLRAAWGPGPPLAAMIPVRCTTAICSDAPNFLSNEATGAGRKRFQLEGVAAAAGTDMADGVEVTCIREILTSAP